MNSLLHGRLGPAPSITAHSLTALLLTALIITTIGLTAPCAEATDRFPVGTRVEVDGRYREDRLEAIKIVIEEPGEYPEVKGFADTINLAKKSLEIGPYQILTNGETDIEDSRDGDDSYRFDELKKEWRLKIEGDFIEPFVLLAREIDVDKKTKREKPAILEVEGFVERSRVESDGTIVLTVNGLECEITPDTKAPDGVFSKTRSDVDEDERRPRDQIVLFDRLTIGGEIQVDFELKDNFDLNERSNEDTFEVDTSVIIEGLFDLGRSSSGDWRYLFAKARSAKGYVIFDEKRDRRLREQTQLEELNLYIERPFHLPFNIRVGRQDFDEEREWLYDENLDAVRVAFKRGAFELEYSWSTYLNDAPRGRSDLWNQVLFARWRIDRKSYLGAYFIDIRDDSSADISPFFAGLRAYGKSRRWLYWADYVRLDGVDGNNKLDGHALDLGLGHQFRDVPGDPYVYGGYAFGSGDGKTSGRVDRGFRQTGYHDNNGRFFGVASFRYYGELFDPELSNLHITTLGVGIQPTDQTSIDLVYHSYRQDERSMDLRDTSLRSAPSGLDRDLGQEIDIIFGVDDLWKRVDIELDLGYFIPGSAFVDDEPAFWAALQLEWSF